MVPFVFSFLGLFSMPFLLTVHNEDTLASINNFVFHIAYSVVAMITLPIFLAVNLALLPFAYLKTVAHKFTLWRHYKGDSSCLNFFSYILFGLPLLACSQFTDAYFFILHSFSDKQR